MTMKLRAIRNEQELNTALARIDELIDSEEPEHLDELEVLSLLVRNYETTHSPMPPPDPMAAIEFILEQRGWDLSNAGFKAD